jgi:hypothetical protein
MLTLPLPVPEAPPDTLSQLALGVAVHAQPLALVTPKDVVPASAPTDTVGGEIVYVQAGDGEGDGAGAAACVTVTVWPAIVSVPVRALPEFSAALKLIDALPRPLDAEVIDSHEV